MAVWKVVSKVASKAASKDKQKVALMVVGKVEWWVASTAVMTVRPDAASMALTNVELKVVVIAV